MREIKRIAALAAGAALLLAGCGQAGEGSGQEAQGTGAQKEEKVDVQAVRLDALEPSAYGNVEGLPLEAGTYISIIGKASGGGVLGPGAGRRKAGCLGYQRHAQI